VGKRDDIISIEVRSPYARDAKEIANAIVSAYFKYQSEQNKSNTREILKLLLTQKNKYDQQLATSRAAKLEFQTKNGMLALGPAAQNNPILERLARLSAALTDIELQTLNAQAAYDATKAMTGDPVKIRQLLETRQFKTETESLRREFRELKKRLAGLSGNYGPNFPELSSIQGAIKQLNDEMQQEDKKIVEAYLAELEQRLLTAKRTEDQIRSQLNAQRAEVLEYNSVAAKYELLQSELEGLEKANEAIDERIKELAITEDATPLNIRSVDAARQENTPVEPAKATVLFESLALGGLLGALIALVRDLLDQRLRSAEEIKQVLSLPVLGVVPHISARSPVQRGLQLHLDPMSDVAEAYRTIRTAVYFGVPGGAAKTLLVTSPSPGDGKTTLASNLAVAMAQAGNRVLLLDADFRKPTQHKIFELDKGVGLSSVLAGETELKQAIRDTPVNGLHVLPCGPIPANPSEILNSQMFADLLEILSDRYDHILLDSPPIVPVTDSRILAASCGATLLALRAEKTTRKTATHAKDVLRAVGARILGVVVNDVPRRRGFYGYYYSDTELYQYGYGRRSSNSGGTGSAGGNGTGKSSTGNGSAIAGGAASAAGASVAAAATSNH
jgi:capsular exopolysaccharide synthesis family protein